MVCPDVVAVLLDHHADPNSRTVSRTTPLDVSRTLTSDFLFKGVVPGLSHIEPNKLRLCLELVQSAALVLSREENIANASFSPAICLPVSEEHSSSTTCSSNAGNMNLDSRKNGGQATTKKLKTYMEMISEVKKPSHRFRTKLMTGDLSLSSSSSSRHKLRPGTSKSVLTHCPCYGLEAGTA